MNNISDIKNIFYINLDTRPDRKQHIEGQLKILGLNATRFNAIKHSSGAIGCSLSHISLLKYAKENNLDHILIMEDDIMFLRPQQFIQNLNNLLSKYTDFDVLLIAGNNRGTYKRLDEFCVKISSCQTTTGYLVKSNYYDILIDNFETGLKKLTENIRLPQNYAIDQYWELLQRKDNWYLLTPLTIIQKPNYSNIEKRPTDYSSAMLDLDKVVFLKMQREQQLRTNLSKMTF